MSEQRFWAVIPAAGAGRRMGSDRPKQYLNLSGRQIIEHTLDIFCRHPRIDGLVVALSPEDEYWASVQIEADKPIYRAEGGSERCQSVLNALHFLAEKTSDSDWVLVHDAARPCLTHGDLDRLIEEAASSEDGGLLAMPCRDTMKLADREQRVSKTVDRSSLWHALTPQMFPLGVLISALERARDEGAAVTDDAMAMERLGYHPRLVVGSAENIKVTRPEDLELAATILERRKEKP